MLSFSLVSFVFNIAVNCELGACDATASDIIFIFVEAVG